MTAKLFWDDSHLSTFTAHIVECQTVGNESTLILDRTAFYPAGGGQPCDLGLIDSATVVEVTIDEGGIILHRLATPTAFRTGQEVICQVDTARRRELTQQHTGQHILSQAFFQLFGAETRGFRINESSSEIDLALDCPPELIFQAIRQAEDLSNQIVFENRIIRTHLVSVEDAAKLPLRKESFLTDCIRIIEIEDYDWSACGGTHAKRTGEVGLIAVKGWERAKKMTRIEFLCGVRVLPDYRVANKTADTLARKFSVSRADIVDAVNRLVDERNQLERRTRQLTEVAAKVEAATLLEGVVPHNGVRIITNIFADRSFDEIKLLAHQLVKAEDVIALLAVTATSTARLVFARSKEGHADMGNLMSEVCQSLGGKGGGTSDFAQGGVENFAELEKVLEAVVKKLQ